MIKTSAPRRAISAALAFVLAATLIPSEVLPEAYAASADNAQSQEQTQDATGETSDATTVEETQAMSSSDATSAGNRPAGIVSATERIADGTAESSSPASSSASTAAPIDMTRASVSLTSGDTTPTLISQAGLTFQVNDDAETVSVVGIDPAADIAHLVIPQTVVSVGREYPVTAIMCGGGSIPHC